MTSSAFVFSPFRTLRTSRSLLNTSCPSVRAHMSTTLSPLRIGHGFDLHRLEPGLPLILGGVTLSHDRGCAGHSDGDAVYHCVVDAILGALSLPDIGQLFPDSDPRFKDCSSHVFMEAAYEKMVEQGYTVGNVDVTIILERPKMAPHKQQIRQNVAALLRTEINNINIKAKTHEKVDAIGENRAVSVHSVAMLVANRGEGEEEKEDVVGEGRRVKKVTEQLLGIVENRVSQFNTRDGDAMDRLYSIVSGKRRADPETSWTARLFEKGRKKIAQKVGEEAVEVVVDAIKDDCEGVVKESADLLYHLSVLWADMGIKPAEVWKELERREGSSGIAEKASRGVKA